MTLLVGVSFKKKLHGMILRGNILMARCAASSENSGSCIEMMTSDSLMVLLSRPISISVQGRWSVVSKATACGALKGMTNLPKVTSPTMVFRLVASGASKKAVAFSESSMTAKKDCI